MNKQYLDLVDVLPLGRSIINVKPLPEFKQDGGKWRPIEGSHQTGIVKTGKNVGAKFYKYDTDVKYYDNIANKERTCQLIAWNAKDKAIIDMGRIEVNILEKPVLLDGEPTYTKDGGVAVKRRVYINALQDKTQGDSVSKDPAYAGMRTIAPEPKEEDIPIINEDDYIHTPSNGDEIDPDSIPL